jgi:hypothetical protein
LNGIIADGIGQAGPNRSAESHVDGIKKSNLSMRYAVG